MMTSILTSIGSLLSGTVTEEFRKLFQPASLIAAALFVTLNLVLVYPFLVEQRVHFVLILQSMGAVAQLALISLLILALGYLVGSLGPAFLGLVTGDSVRDARLVQATLTRLEEHRFQSLQADLRSPEQNLQARALHALAFEFPAESQRIAPSRLGNVVDSVASYTWNQHGAALDTLWPVMEHVLRDKNQEMQARIQQSQTTLTFFASLVVLLLVVLFELVMVRLSFGRPGWLAYVVLGGLLLLATRLVYSAAVRAALAWSRDVRAAFDLYTSEVETRLALRPLASYELEKEQKRKVRLREVSWWLAHGPLAIPEGTGLKMPAPDADWYYPKPVPAPSLTLTAAPGLAVQSRRQVVEEWAQRRESRHEFRLPGRIIDLVLVVSNEQGGQGAQTAGGSFLIAQDSGLPALPDRIDGTLTGAGAGITSLQPRTVQGQRLPGNPESLLWDLGSIPPRASRLLRYRVAYDLRVRVSPPARIDNVTLSPVSPGLPRVQATITCSGSAQGSLTLTVRVANEEQLSPAAVYAVEGGDDAEVEVSFDPAGQEGSWSIPNVPQGATVRTRFWLEPL